MVQAFVLCFWLVNPIHLDISRSGVKTKILFEEDLRIGPESDEEYGIWPGPYLSFDIHKNGHIFIADDQEGRILEFDTDGSFLKQHSRSGQGPGEFENLINFQFLADGRAVAFESGGNTALLSYFDTDMNFVKRENAMGSVSPSTLVISPDGNLGFVQFAQGFPQKGYMEKGAVLVDSNMKVLMTHLSYKVQVFNPQRAMEPAFWSEFISSQLRPNFKGMNYFGCFDEKGNYYGVAGDLYKVERWDRNMNKTLELHVESPTLYRTEDEMMMRVNTIRDQLDAQLPPNMAAIITDSVVKKAIQLSEYTPNKPPVYGITAMEKGHFMVIVDIDGLSRTDQAQVFDAQGNFVAFITKQGSGLGNMIFRNGYAYCIERDADEEQTLVRYKVEWDK